MRSFKDVFAVMGGRVWVALFAAMILALSGCGGSSDSGNGSGGNGNDGGGVSFNEDQATISDKNDAKESAVAAQQTAEQAINEEDSGIGGDIGSTPASFDASGQLQSEQLLNNALEVADSAALPAAAKQTVAGPCGGEATVDTETGSGNVSINYDNWCSDGYIFNGDYSTNGPGGTLNYDITVTGNGVNYHLVCNQNGCTNDYVGTNGETYRTSDVSVSGDNSNGYNVNARVYSGDLGYVDYEATNLVMCGAPDYGFQSGTITITDSTGSSVVSVSFSDCSSYTVFYEGDSFTVNY